MGTVFISYARKDSAFVRRLHDALEARGREAWVDWEGIPPTEKWLAKIRSAIEEADAFLFVISPEAVASEVCGIELDYAIKQHKRLIPVVYREPEPGQVRRELSEINYIFARDTDSFDTACETLITALDTDLDWTRAHTRLLVRSIEWDRESRDASYTLRGRDLDEFEEWLAKSPDKEPKPTSLQSEYLLASRRTVTRRQRIAGAIVAVGLSIAIGLGTIAYFQHRERVRQETISAARELVNRAEALRDGPVDTEGARDRLAESTRAAVRALQTFHELGMPTLSADQAVRKSYAVLPKWMDTDLGNDRIDASSFDAAGAYLVMFRGRERLTVWDTAQYQKIGTCPRSLAAMESSVAVAVGGAGTLVASAVYNAAKGKAATEITVWSMADCSRKLRVQVPGRRARLALDSQGEHLLVDDGTTIRAWEVASRSELALNITGLVQAFAPSPDGRWLATIERDRGERQYWVRIRDLTGAQALRAWPHPKRVTWLQWHPHRLVVRSRNTASIYDPDSGQLIQRLPVDKRRFALSPNGRFRADLGVEYAIQIREVATDTEIERSSHDVDVADMAFGADNRSLVTVDAVNRRIRWWRFAKEEAYAVIHDGPAVGQMHFSPDGSRLFTASGESISAWRLPLSGEPTAPERQPATDSAAKPLGQFHIELTAATGSAKETSAIKIREAASGGVLRTITLEARALTAVLSHDGGRLAVILAMQITRGGSNRRLEAWDVETGVRLATRGFDAVPDEDIANYLQFAGDDRYLVVGTREGVAIVDAAQLTPVATLYHRGAKLTVIQGAGTLAATAGSDGSVRIWKMVDREEIARITSVQELAAIALSNDGRWLATLDAAGTVRLWTLASGDLIEQACRWVPEPCP